MNIINLKSICGSLEFKGNYQHGNELAISYHVNIFKSMFICLNWLKLTHFKKSFKNTII